MPRDRYGRIPDEECGEDDYDGNRPGGDFANAVYSNNLYEPNDYEFLGCFTDDEERDFRYGP
jgi:hypothetical protein